MAFISFALTTEQFLSGKKTVTRRDWHPHYRELWQRWYAEGRVVHTAWDKVPFAGGKRIGRFRLTCAPYVEQLCDMPLSDLQAEGGMCATRVEFYALIGKNPTDFVTVIRFEKVSF